MRQLLLIRHAKSSWKHSELDDHDRPLNKRGERDSLLMARVLAEKHQPLEVIYCSTAKRAVDYATLISEFSGVSLLPDLSFYTFDEDELLQIIQHLSPDLNAAAVVAHNPAITELVNSLTDSKIKNVPTSGVVSIDCDIQDWSELEAGCGVLNYFEYPKMFN